jgi:hypothetical protein
MRNMTNGYASMNLSSAGLDPGESLKMTVMMSSMLGGPPDAGQLSFVIELHENDASAPQPTGKTKDSDDEEEEQPSPLNRASASASSSSAASSASTSPVSPGPGIARVSFGASTSRQSESSATTRSSSVTPKGSRRQSTVVIPKWVDDDIDAPAAEPAPLSPSSAPAPAPTPAAAPAVAAPVSAPAPAPAPPPVPAPPARPVVPTVSKPATGAIQPVDDNDFIPDRSSSIKASFTIDTELPIDNPPPAVATTPKTPVSRRHSAKSAVVIPKWVDDGEENSKSDPAPVVNVSAPSPPPPPPPPTPPAQPMNAGSTASSQSKMSVDTSSDASATSATKVSADAAKKPPAPGGKTSPSAKPLPPSAPRPTSTPKPVKKPTAEVKAAEGNDAGSKSMMTKLFGNSESTEALKSETPGPSSSDASVAQQPDVPVVPTRRLSLTRRASLEPDVSAAVAPIISQVPFQQKEAPSAQTSGKPMAPPLPPPTAHPPAADVEALIYSATVSLKGTVHALEETVDTQSQEITLLKRQITRLESDKTDLVRKHHLETEDAQSERNLLREDIEKLTQSLTTAETSIKKQAETSEHVISQLKDKLAASEKKYLELQAQAEETDGLLVRVQTELNEKKHEIADMQSVMSELDAEIAELNEQKEANAQTVNPMTETIHSTSSHSTAATENEAKLKADMEALLISHQEVVSKLTTELQMQEASSRENVRLLQRDFDAKIADHLAEIEEKNEAYALIVDELNSVKAEMVSKGDSLDNSDSELQSKLVDYEATIESQKEQLVALSSAESKLQSELRALRRSLNEAEQRRVDVSAGEKPPAVAPTAFSSSSTVSSSDEDAVKKLEAKLAKESYEKKLLKSELAKFKVESEQQQRSTREYASRVDELEKKIASMTAEASGHNKLVYEQQQLLLQQQQQYLQLQRINILNTGTGVAAIEGGGRSRTSSFTTSSASDRRSVNRGSFLQQQDMSTTTPTALAGSASRASFRDGPVIENLDSAALATDGSKMGSNEMISSSADDEFIRRMSSSIGAPDFKSSQYLSDSTDTSTELPVLSRRTSADGDGKPKRLSINLDLADKVEGDAGAIDVESPSLGLPSNDSNESDTRIASGSRDSPSMASALFGMAADVPAQASVSDADSERFSPELTMAASSKGASFGAGSAGKKGGSVRFATDESAAVATNAQTESVSSSLQSDSADQGSGPDTASPQTVGASPSTPARTPLVTPRRSSRFFGPDSPALIAIGTEAAAAQLATTTTIPFADKPAGGRGSALSSLFSALEPEAPAAPAPTPASAPGPLVGVAPPAHSPGAMHKVPASVPSASKSLRESFTEESMKQMRRTPRQSVKYEQQQEQLLRREKLFHEEKQQQQLSKVEEQHRNEVLALKKEIERLSKDLVNSKLQKSLGSLPKPPLLGNSSPGREDSDLDMDYMIDEIEQSSGSNEGFRRYLRRASTAAVAAAAGGVGIDDPLNVLKQSNPSQGVSRALSGSGEGDSSERGGDDGSLTANISRKAAWLRGGALARAGMDLPSQCQRKLIRTPNATPYTLFFPLELTIRDYHRRVLDIVGAGIRDRVVFMYQAGSLRQTTGRMGGSGGQAYSPQRTNEAAYLSSPGAGLGSSIGVSESKSSSVNESGSYESLRLDTIGMLELLTAKNLSADVAQKSIYAAVSRTLGITNADDYLSPARILMALNVQQQNMRIDSSRLSKLPILFDAAQQLLTCFTIASQNSNNIFAKSALAELKELEEQLDLHSAYKEQRIKILGWSWGVDDRGDWRNKKLSAAEINHLINNNGSVFYARQHSSSMSSSGSGGVAVSKDLGFDHASNQFAQSTGSNYGEQSVLANALTNYLNTKTAGVEVNSFTVPLSARKPSVNRTSAGDLSSIVPGAAGKATGDSSDQLAAMPQGENFLHNLRRFVFSFAAPSDKEMEQVRGQIISCIAQMELFLHPREMALSALVIRLALLSDFLYSKSTFMNVRGDDMEAHRLQLLGQGLERTLEDEDAFDIEASTNSIETRDEFINRMTDVKVVDLSSYLSPAGAELQASNSSGAAGTRLTQRKESERVKTTDVINAARHRMTGRGRLEQVLKLEKQTLGLIERLSGAKLDASNRNKFDEEEKIEVDLSKLTKLSAALKKITTQNFPMSLMDIERKLSTVGTTFLTADFVFHAPHPDDGLSIGSLLIQIGSRILLGRIVNLWPGLSVHTVITESVVENAVAGTTGSPDPAAGVSASGGGRRRSSMRRPSTLAIFGTEETNSGSMVNIDFADACSLRLAGFSFQQLRASGKFTDAQILKAGCFSAKELREVGFRVSDLRGAGYSVSDCRLAGFDVAQARAGGFDEPTIVKTGGYSLSQLKFANCDIQRHALMSLFESTNGKHWKKKQNW